MEGWLTKKGHQFKTWQKRWFVLEKHRLCYYEKDNKKALKGTYILSASAHITRTPDEGSHKNLFVLHAEGSGGKQLVMSAASPEQMVEWEAAINGMINLYKKPTPAKKKKSINSDERKPSAAEAVAAPEDVPAAAAVPEPEAAPVVEPEATPAPVVAAIEEEKAAYVARALSDPPVVVVLGASGGVGQATVASLASSAAGVAVTAGTRDVNTSKAAALRSLGGVKVIGADMAAERSVLSKNLSSADRVFIVTPGSQDRTDLAINAVNACRDAGVGYMLVLSVCSAAKSGTIFADQFIPIEAAAASSGIPHTIIRLPFFLDNVLGQLQLMINNGQFYLPVEGKKRYNAVALSDVGEACAKILANPAPYVGRTINVTGSLFCELETAAAFSNALRKPVDFVQVPYEVAKASMMSMGMPEWQVDGSIQLYQLVEASDPSMCEMSEGIQEVLGRPPISIKDFAARYEVVAPDPSPEPVAAVYTARAPSNPPVVAVLGSSGSVGISTLTNLGAMPDVLAIKACVRDVASVKMKALSHIDHVSVEAGDMADPASLRKVLSVADRVFVVAPGAENRTELAINAINACKEAGVGYMLILSVMTVARPGTIFADQFLKIEAAAVASGIPHTILRLPFFLDNVMGQLQLMMNTGKYYGPISPSKKHNSIAVSDVGEAAAKILADPTSYVGKVLELCGPVVSEQETAAAFAAGLDKPVEYVQVPFEASKASMIQMGLPEWQTNGIMEMFQMIESEDGLLTSHRGELEAILGHPAKTISELAAPVEFSGPREVTPLVEEAKTENAPADEKKADPVPEPIIENEPEPPKIPEPEPASVVARAAPVSKKGKSSSVDSIFKEGLMVLKKTGAENRYHERYVWIDMATSSFNWSKKEFDKTDNKNIPLSSVQSIEGPTFEKKTGRRGSILGGGNTEDGHVIKLMQKNGFSIDLKIPASNARTPEQWKEMLDALIV